ncbi:MAG TPA: L-serine ammonia-lyase, partial [Hyphomonas sp.]|nr:L-serine ammonia-lyase [Hyphomonas sp.]
NIGFDPAADIRFAYHVIPKLHPNGIRLRAFDASGAVLADSTWYSTGGGFIASQRQLERPLADDIVPTGPEARYPFYSAAELLATCEREALSIDAVIMANEAAKRS